MRWEVAYSTALSIGVLWTSSCHGAFAPTALTHTVARPSRNSLGVGNLGWDNDDFLESLGKGPKDREQANERYRAMSRYSPRSNDDDDVKAAPLAGKAKDEDLSEAGTAGAQLTEEMKAKIRASHTPEEEASQGGSMFRSLLSRAQQNAAERYVPPPPPVYPPPVYPPPPAAVAPPVPPANLENMSVEEQAAMFRRMMAQQQQQPQPQQAPPPQPGYNYAPPPPPMPGSYLPPPVLPVDGQQPQNYLRPGFAADGRRIGRNRDADAIVNSSDLYFAQLKRDSSVRSVARYHGDEEFANKVFADPAIQDLKLHINPFLEAQRDKEKELLETSVDEMIIPELLAPDEPVDLTKAGVSYKDKLNQRRNKQTGTPPLAAAPPPRVATQSAPAMKSSAVQPPQTERVAQAPVQPVAQAPVQPVTPPQQPTMASPGVTQDIQKDTRTLMGLLLKHRGGPGFGAGRLQGPEIERFDDLSDNLLENLRTEAIDTPAAVQPKTSMAPPTLPSAQSAPSASRASSMLACIEGALQMYKNSPVELRDSVLVALRAALLAAVNTCNDLMPASTAAMPSVGSTSNSNMPVAERTASMVAYLEGAILMYKNSPPELQPSILVALRAALLSAVATCNSIIADQEVQDYQATTRPAAPVAAPAKAMPQQDYSVVDDGPRTDTFRVSQNFPLSANKVDSKSNQNMAQALSIADDESAEVLDRVYNKLQNAERQSSLGLRSNLSPEEASLLWKDVWARKYDENTQELERVYDKLKNAAGQGKLGLRSDLTAEEASILSKEVSEMRLKLVDELKEEN